MTGEQSIENLLRTVTSKRCLERGLIRVKILDATVEDGYGFYTVKADDEGSEVHAVKIFPDGTIYCSHGFSKGLIERKKLCSHLVAAIADMDKRGVDVSEIVKKLVFG